MGRLLKRLQKPKTGKKKVSFIFSEQTIEKLEELRELIGYQNKSEFVEKLLDFALTELEKELKKANVLPKKEEKLEEKTGDLTASDLPTKFQSGEGYIE